MRNLTGLKPYSKDNPPPGHTQKHPNGYLTSKLKRLLLKKKFRYEDPETQKILQMVGGDAIVIKYIWEALQGNVQAIEGIFDRIDGKLNSNSPLIDQSQHYHLTVEERNARINRIKEFAKRL